MTSWLSCDTADANPVRFWTGFIEAPRVIAPGFGADAEDLLAMDNVMSADVTASIANDAAKLPAGSAIVVDDFHTAAAAATSMTDLVERWPAEIAQLVLCSRSDPALRLHRLRMAGELCELRDRDLYFSLAQASDLLVNFGVEVGAADLALLHQRTEGWVAALHMAALSLRGARDPVHAARAFEVNSRALTDYFLSEVLDQQPPEVTQFMLDISILSVLTEATCAAVTGRQDAAALLHRIDTAHLFLVALDDERTSFRFHRLVRNVLRAELRARDRDRERKLQLRVAEWFESNSEKRRAARHFLAAQQPDRALNVIQDSVVNDFLSYPVAPEPLDLSMVDASLLAHSPDRLLAVAADLLIWGDTNRGGEYLELLERTQPPIQPESRLAVRFAVMRCFHHALTGRLNDAVRQATTARELHERAQLTDDWTAAIPLILLRLYPCLEDFEAVEREAAVALATPAVGEPVKRVLVPSARALALFEVGRLSEAADAARAAAADADRIGLGQHFFAVDFLRVLSGIALERHDLDAAEQFSERALSIAEQRRPLFEFLVLIDRARIWAARGQIREALTTVEAARHLLARGRTVLTARADELEALLRLSLGDLRTPAELTDRLRPVGRSFLLAKIALASGDYRAAQEQLQSPLLRNLTPRRVLEREILLAAAAIERSDPMTESIMGGILQMARHGGFFNTVVTTAPQVTSYLVTHSTQTRPDPFTEQLTRAALEVHAIQPDGSGCHDVLTEPLTAAELRILKLLPTSTYLQIAATLYISRNTVKTHLRSIYQKLGVTSRSAAVERAVDLRLL
jgi:LuxR family maltose regulon positive regulatory protein